MEFPPYLDDGASPEMETSDLANARFGSDIRREFLLRSDTIFTNHGSFGTVPRRVFNMQTLYNAEREEHPDAWYRIKAKKYLDRAVASIAARINASPANVVTVDNATTAINCTVKAFPLEKGDAILDTTHTYQAIYNLCGDMADRIKLGVERVNLPLHLPIANEDHVIALYQAVLDEHPNIRLAIIDHITTPTSILMPVKRLCALFRARGVTAIVDGAHAFGQLPLDMQDIGADVYIANLHKWGYCPRGTAFIWFSQGCRPWIRPPNTSCLVRENLDLQFFNQGTRDHVPVICARHAIEFQDALGGLEKTVAYSSALAKKGKQLLESIGFTPLDIPVWMEAPNMKCLRLPPIAKYSPCTVENLWRLRSDLFTGSKIFAIIVLFHGGYWLRLSAQIYNTLDDMTALVHLLSEFINKSNEECIEDP